VTQVTESLLSKWKALSPNLSTAKKQKKKKKPLSRIVIIIKKKKAK
jgi:hypothetical protein